MGRKDETIEEFHSRILARTGVAFSAIPKTYTLDGHIVAHHWESNTFVFYTGYPAGEDEDGTKFWGAEALRAVTLVTVEEAKASYEEARAAYHLAWYVACGAAPGPELDKAADLRRAAGLVVHEAKERLNALLAS